MRATCLLILLTLAPLLTAQAPSRASSVDELNKLPADTTSITLSKPGNAMLEALPRFTKLKRLAVYAVGSTTDDAGLAHVAKLTSLTELILQGCDRYTDSAIEALAALTNLEQLELQNGKFSDAAAAKLGKLGKLTKLDFSSNSTLTGVCFADFAPDCAIEEIDLNLCPAFSTAGCKAVARLKNLEDLGASGMHVTLDGVTALAAAPELHTLTIGGEGCDDSVCPAIAGIAGLKVLKLGRGRITDEGAKHFAKLAKLHTLHVSMQPVGDATLEAFKAHAALTVLYLNHSEVTAKGLPHLKTMPELDDVSLDNVPLDAAACKALSECNQLTALSLEDCEVDDSGVALLATMSNLTRLNLAENPISAEGALKLATLTKLRVLNLSENKAITEDTVTKLKESLKDAKISFDKPKK